jgi:hypothetical protein
MFKQAKAPGDDMRPANAAARLGDRWHIAVDETRPRSRDESAEPSWLASWLRDIRQDGVAP